MIVLIDLVIGWKVNELERLVKQIASDCYDSLQCIYSL